jgi:hypothetical protein
MDMILSIDIDIGDRNIKGITSRDNMDMRYGGGDFRRYWAIAGISFKISTDLLCLCHGAIL